MYKAIWMPSTLLVIRLANVNSQVDGSIPLDARLVTLEDEGMASFTQQTYLRVNDPVHVCIASALKQI